MEPEVNWAGAGECLAIGNIRTEEKHIERTWELLTEGLRKIGL
jgi:hypothetical protein